MSVEIIIPIYNIKNNSERKRNTFFVLSRIIEAGIKVSVAEQVSYSMMDFSCFPEVNHIKIESREKIFNKSQIMNEAAKFCKSKYIWFHDSDIYLPFGDVLKKIDCDFSVVSPYSQVVVANQIETEKFIKNKSISISSINAKIIGELCGGSVIIRRSDFIGIGGWNENYSGWGYEDKEMTLRCKKSVSYSILNFCGIHLYHKVGTYDVSIIKKNKKRYNEDKIAMDNDFYSYYSRINSEFIDKKLFLDTIINMEEKKKYSVAKIVILDNPSKDDIVNIVGDFIFKYEFGENLYLFSKSHYSEIKDLCLDYQINGENIIPISSISEIGDETNFVLYSVGSSIDANMDEKSFIEDFDIDPRGVAYGNIESLKDNESFGKIMFFMSNFHKMRIESSCSAKKSGVAVTLLSFNNANFIAQTIESVLPFAKKLIIADGGSKDGSLDIISSFSSDKIKIVNYEWKDNFSEARSILLDEAKKTSAEWIMQIDSDEVVCERFCEKIFEYLCDDRYDTIWLPMVWLFSNSPFRYVASDYHTNVAPWRPRMWRNNSKLYYKGNIVHEHLVTPWDESRERKINDPDTVIIHYCYVLKSYYDRIRKIEFYDRLKSGAGSSVHSRPAYIYEDYPFELRDSVTDMFKRFCKNE